MILLLIIISIIAAVFAAALDYEDILNKNTKPRYLISGLSIAVGIAVYILFHKFWYSYNFLIPAGFTFTLISFIYLEVFSIRLKLNHFSIHLLMVVILTAISRIDLMKALFISLIYITCYIIFSLAFNKLLPRGKPKSEDIRSALELSRMLNGIFMLIISLIFATNRIHFLEKIAQFLFD